MSVDLRSSNAKIDRASAILTRARSVIANSQSKSWPYDVLNHETRIYCAILAAQARDLALRALSQLGLKAETPVEAREEQAAQFVSASADYVSTDPISMLSARVAALSVLVEMAHDLIAKAERVLEGNETVGGAAIVHTDLSEK
ncbi:MAG: hypothetical protein K2Z81_16905 [Cyanobacteria bacterium]|nr:hypothetical protein [Cyanobacteriota bacterium]